MSDKLRIMLVDDHYLVRVGLTSVIALEPDMIVCAEAATGEQAIASFRTHRPDVHAVPAPWKTVAELPEGQSAGSVRRQFPPTLPKSQQAPSEEHTFVGEQEVPLPT